MGGVPPSTTTNSDFYHVEVMIVKRFSIHWKRCMLLVLSNKGRVLHIFGVVLYICKL